MKKSLFLTLLLTVCILPAALGNPLELYSFGNQGTRQRGTALNNVKLIPGKAGGFFRSKNNLPLDSLGQFSFKFQSNVPGTLRLAASLLKSDGSRVSGNMPPVTFVPDEKSQLIVWELTDMPHWQNCVTLADLEIKFTPSDPAAEALVSFSDANFTKNPKLTAEERAAENLRANGFMYVDIYSFGNQNGREHGSFLSDIKLISGKAGGFFRPKNNLPMSAITQFEVEFKSNVAGSLRLSASLQGKSGNFSNSLKAIPVEPGEFQKVVFDLTQMPGYSDAEKLNDMEVRFIPSDAASEAVISVKNPRFNYRPTANNTTPAASKENVQTTAAAKTATVLHSFGNQGKRQKGTALSDIKLIPGKAGGFFRANSKYPTAQAAALELEFKSSVPGKLQFSTGLGSADGSNGSGKLPPVAVEGNGEYQKIIFVMTDMADYRNFEFFKEIELRFVPNDPAAEALISFRNANLIAPEAVASVLAKQSKQLAFLGESLRKNIHISRFSRLQSTDGIECTTQANVQGAFYQEKVNWDASEIKQIEFTLKSDAPGYWQFTCSNTFNGKRSSVRISPQAAITDGEYHHYIFVLDGMTNYEGVMTNWELKWVGEPARIGIKAVRGVKYLNRVPDAENLKANQASLLGLVMPRSQCRLSYINGDCPGAVLRFYDLDLKEIPDTAVTLHPGEKSVDFVMPEYAVESRIEMLADGKGMPLVEQLLYTCPQEAGGLFWRGNWIWSQKGEGPIDHSIWFEREFELDELPDFAVMSAAGDDGCYTYVNGHFMGKTGRWSLANRYEITPYLKKGRNRISCRVKNIDGQGGFIADVYVKLPSNELFLDSDSSWRCESKSGTDRTIPKAEEDVVIVGNSRVGPWNGGMMFCYTGKQGLITPIKIEPGRMTVKVEALPVVPVKKMRFVTVDEKGRKIDFMLPVSPDSSQWNVGDEITIQYNMPYVDRGVSKLYLDDYFVRIPGNPVLAEIDRSHITPPALRRASWAGGGRPMLKMDDELIQPVFWQAPSSYGKDHLVGITFFKNNNIRSYRISAWFQDYYLPDGSLDFTSFDKEVATLLTLVPDAVFSIQVYSFMPEWWLALHPDHTSTHYQNRPRHLWLDKQAMGSDLWLEEGGMLVKALIDHIKNSGYADRVWGLSFTENGCGEWFYTSADANDERSYAGYSPSDYETFRRFLRERYKTDEALAAAWKKPGLTFETVEMPYLETARKGSVGTLLDPQKDQQMIDFFIYRSLRVAEVIAHFGKITKENTDNKWLVGAYYGYFSEMIANPRRNIQSNGHNGFIEAARSPYVDFVHAPLRYTIRKTGQPGTSMQVWDSFLLHGKMVYVEQDVRTSLSPVMEFPAGKIYCGTPENPFGDIGQFYRSYGMTAATGMVNYWYDLNCKQFDEKVLNQAISGINDSYLALGSLRNTTPFEVAVVSDRDSAWYTQFPAVNSPNTMASEALFKHFNELAVPFKNLTVTDLLDENISVQPFKCYIMMPMVMLSKEKREQLMARFQREKATVIWLYCAGPTYPTHGPSAENNGDFLGIKFQMSLNEIAPEMTTNAEYGNLVCRNAFATSPLFYPQSGYDASIGSDRDGKALMVVKKIGNSTHYVTALTNLPVELYSKIFDKTGIHRYSNKLTNDNYWIGNDVLFIHAGSNGAKSFVLPEGCTARAIAGPFKGTLASGESFEARAGMTYGFVVERQ